MSSSVQEMKSELVRYVKEFGGDVTQWSIGIADDAPTALFQMHEVDPVRDVWLWKPAASPADAALVVDWMTDSKKATLAAGDVGGQCVFMFKKD